MCVCLPVTEEKVLDTLRKRDRQHSHNKKQVNQMNKEKMVMIFASWIS